MSSNNFALSKKNLIIIGVAAVIILIGFILMSGPGTTVEEGFNPDIFSPRRIKVAPIVCMIGFVLMIFGIMIPSENKKETNDSNQNR
ncbi:MAG: hypothetical protein BWZ06_01547 [Bacteroidetes bacterium ADurb.BinA261]|jgi:uncharacterized membrane protein|nr:hypothetical protein [Bacteroidota bacterium]OPZ12239.1 MAG: hypothetical protein BWZ06_01547 [Bacteroidetes bacterium ADurb.BinA261]HOV35377.1 DUF3098 domain-containing protein [Dysgonamonadaceae bacterium]HQI43102.1 DUF3098 domain-containing protein [Dysgonamonadaceae bacterium]